MANSVKSKFCSVCGATAIGKHFNAHTCLSCKVFFRRNALCNPDEDLIECAFDNDCVIDSRSRRFCSKCRLRKCFAVGMEKEKIKSQVEIKKAKEKQSISNINQQYSVNNSADLIENTIPNNSDTFDLFETNNPMELSPISLSSSMEEFSDLLQYCSDDTSFRLTPQLPELCDSMVLYNHSQHNRMVDLNATQFHQNFEPPTIALPIDLKFLNFELILSEKYLLKELTDACEVLRNPYRQMRTLEYTPPSHTCNVTQYFFNRLIGMSRGLSRFTRLPEKDQLNMLKYNLVDMFSLQTVLMYDPDRKAYAFVDDNYQISTLIKLDMIKPHCSINVYEKFGEIIKVMFRHEWKRDSVIFDLLTAILLFSPYANSTDCDNISEEAQRYTRLLRRYLEIKYPTDRAEAEDCFFALMDNLNHIRNIKNAVIYFLKGHAVKSAKTNTTNECLNCRLNMI